MNFKLIVQIERNQRRKYRLYDCIHLKLMKMRSSVTESTSVTESRSLKADHEKQGWGAVRESSEGEEAGITNCR